MTNSAGSRTRGFIIVCAVVLAVAALPLLSRARTSSTSVNVVNNSSREIRNVYTSHVDADDWGADLLGEAVIQTGNSSNISNIACDSQQIKLIAEDQDGCFSSTVVACGESSTWTITNDTTRDCGSY
jgi:hypothetical protein